jgi:8-oxo-dGTP diphosphatase
MARHDSPDHPVPTADVIIEVGRGADRRVVLIRRKNPPPGWALPGGFVDRGETVAAAAVREAREETSLEVELTELFHVYADPARDPRLHTVSTVFLARPRDPDPEQVLRGADDAAEAALFRVADLPTPLAFDHGLILADYLRYRDQGVRPPPER